MSKDVFEFTVCKAANGFVVIAKTSREEIVRADRMWIAGTVEELSEKVITAMVADMLTDEPVPSAPKVTPRPPSGFKTRSVPAATPTPLTDDTLDKILNDLG